MAKFVKRWGTSIKPEPVFPGIYLRQDGRFLCRFRMMDPLVKQKREYKWTVSARNKEEAFRLLQEERDRVRKGELRPASSTQLFSTFAASVFEKKISKNRIQSAKTREKWEHILRLHILPTFQHYRVDNPIPTAVIDNWVTASTSKLTAGGRCYSPRTINGWISVLSVIVAEASRMYDWPKNPMIGLELADTSSDPIYSSEEPNSLTADECPKFLAKLKELYPQYFAFAFLGFATGWRPSSLRPLRRQGKDADILWEKNTILIRRSQTKGDEVMDKTKQGKHYQMPMPEAVMDVLRVHVDNLTPGKRRESNLLFPSRNGGFLAKSVLDKPFRAVAKALNLRKTITPRAMRRTFQDVARNAGVKDIVTRQISGHATEAMQVHYSTLEGSEIRSGLGEVARIIGRECLEDRQRTSSGAEVVLHNYESKEGGGHEVPKV
jgi:hypothetical protein